MKTLVLSCLLAWTLVGCASQPRQTEMLLAAPPEIAPVAKLNVPFVEQSIGYCGPATLTMAMHAAGAQASLDEIAREVYTPKKRGSLQADMVSAVRRGGMMGVELEGLPAVLEEVAAGYPVIVFENLGFTWYPIWHYALVVGYDLPRQEIILHSGREADQRVPLTYFEHAWKLGQYWNLAVLPPGQIAKASELANVQGAAGLEQVGNWAGAEAAYEAIAMRWPSSLGALVGLGNVNYHFHRAERAAFFLRRAARLHPESVIARHNLSVAENALDE